MTDDLMGLTLKELYDRVCHRSPYEWDTLEDRHDPYAVEYARRDTERTALAAEMSTLAELIRDALVQLNQGEMRAAYTILSDGLWNMQADADAGTPPVGATTEGW